MPLHAACSPCRGLMVDCQDYNSKSGAEPDATISHESSKSTAASDKTAADGTKAPVKAASFRQLTESNEAPTAPPKEAPTAPSKEAPTAPAKAITTAAAKAPTTAPAKSPTTAAAKATSTTKRVGPAQHKASLLTAVEEMNGAVDDAESNTLIKHEESSWPAVKRCLQDAVTSTQFCQSQFCLSQDANAIPESIVDAIFEALSDVQSVLNSVADGQTPFEMLLNVGSVFECIHKLFDSMGESVGGWETVRRSVL